MTSPKNYSQAALGILTLASNVKGCNDELELAEMISAAASLLGASSWVFTMFTRGDEEHNYHFISNAPPGWVQKYVGQRWYITDQSLQYAQINGEGRQISTLPVETPGQQALRDTARRHGLVDGYIFPAHSAIQSRVGALQLFVSESAAIEQPIDPTVAMSVRAFVTAVLDRMMKRLRDEVIAASGLTDRDIRLMKMSDKGFPSSTIAELEGSSQRSVDQAFTRLISKFGMHRRKAVIDYARQIGLI